MTEIPGLLVGIDIGGTFTDLIAYNPQTEQWRSAKVVTSTGDPGEAVFAGLEQLLEPAERARVALACHATTLAINAIIERRGARSALLTTRGFTDLLAMGSGQRYDVYELFPAYPEPLIPSELRFPITERASSSGGSLVDLDADDVRKAVEGLKAGGAESVAICFLHSYVNTDHEEQAAAIVSELAADLPISLSSAVIPEVREFPRLSTTVANAYIRPVVGRYLTALAERLREKGYTCQFLTMLSSGGMASPEIASRFPVRILESGPAGGAVLAEVTARTLPVKDLLLFDMGGTTAKISIVIDGSALRTAEFEVARVHRFKAGSGLPIRTPVLDLLEIGAGGGSIARLDERGLLAVGPQSAGADPGPACYGRGGSVATVTDADLVLGYLDPNRFLGGRLVLDLDASRRALEFLGAPLGLGIEEAAWFVHSTVNASMAGAARVHLTERGLDPTAMWLMAIGGAGPVHAERVGREVGVESVVVPLDPGVGSAVGLVMAPVAFDVSRSTPSALDALEWPLIQKVLADLDTEARDQVVAAAAADAEIIVTRSVDMHLEGQSHELNVPIPLVNEGDYLTAIMRAFSATYLKSFGRPPLQRPLHVVTWRVRAWAPSRGSLVSRLPPSLHPGASVTPAGSRAAYFAEEGGFVTTPVYRRGSLAVGRRFRGPVIIEEEASSIICGPKSRVEVLEDGSIRMQLR